MSRKARALAIVVDEAKQHPPVRGADGDAHLDWDRLEERVMASIESDARRSMPIPSRRGRSFGGPTAVVFAGVLVAAAALMVLRHRPVPTTIAAGEATVSSLRETVGTGEVRINGASVKAGYAVRAGDAIEVDGARAVFVRPHEVSWFVDGPSSLVRVKTAGEPLVLGLEHGVVEAQVVPVPVGEAFAVDIQSGAALVRVAVHGTHLRVTRTGDHVVVDLSEGVVAIGVPPASGVTQGTTVIAPAHIELDVADLSTLRIDREPASVRPAVSLGAHRQAAPPRADSAANHPVSNASMAKSTPPRADVPKASAPDKAETSREAIAAAVRDCAARRVRSGDVAVTVTSDLHLRVDTSGVAVSAQFVPPLSPDIQECAARTIYAVRFEEQGVVTIPLSFSY